VGKPFFWREFSQTGNSSLAVLVIAAHEQPFGPVYPALHKQLFKRVLPAAELEFPGQLLD